MNIPIHITVVDQMQAAEKRHYLALQEYDKALRTMTSLHQLDLLKMEICEAFAELKAAHDQLLDCGEVLRSANG